MTVEEQTLTLQSGGKRVSFTLTGTSLVVKHVDSGKGSLDVLHRQVIRASFTDGRVQVYYVARKKAKELLSLVKIEGSPISTEEHATETWVDAVNDAAYAGLKQNKRLKVLVNPYSGHGKAVSIYAKKVEPVFTAAGCTLDVIETTHVNHALEIARDLSLHYDAVVPMSGDGTIHEIINGFAQHKEPMKAFATPIAPIPTGSGNGLALNVLGLQDAADVVSAALNVLKGRPMSADLFSVTQKEKRTFSFMSQALGLMADLDVGTDNLRWMGPIRFTVGFLRGVVQMRPCPIELSIKVAEDDKMKMAKALQSRHERSLEAEQEIPKPDNPSTSLPALKYTAQDTDGWITFDKPLLWVYAGKGPYVARDVMAFPVSLPNDGFIDLVAQEIAPRTEVVTAMGEAATGQAYWMKTAHYYKAHAYRVKPLSKKGHFAVDGEAFPFEEFQVEVHQSLATLLSPYGYYAAEFALPRKSVD